MTVRAAEVLATLTLAGVTSTIEMASHTLRLVERVEAQAKFACTLPEPYVLFERLGVSRYFWRFIHNALVHPLMAWPWEPKWVRTLHDWAAEKMREDQSND